MPPGKAGKAAGEPQDATPAPARPFDPGVVSLSLTVPEALGLVEAGLQPYLDRFAAGVLGDYGVITAVRSAEEQFCPAASIAPEASAAMEFTSGLVGKYPLLVE